jgi:hypothetical protein
VEIVWWWVAVDGITYNGNGNCDRDEVVHGGWWLVRGIAFVRSVFFK